MWMQKWVVAAADATADAATADVADATVAADAATVADASKELMRTR